MSLRKLSDAQKQQLIQAVQRGTTMQSVGTHWGVSRASVHAYLKRHWPGWSPLTTNDLTAIGRAADGADMGPALQLLFADRGGHFELIDPKQNALQEHNPRWITALAVAPNRWVPSMPAFSCLVRDGRRIVTLTVNRHG